jgi:hypothetical protein
MRPPLFARPLVGRGSTIRGRSSERADDVDALELAGLEEPLGELVEFSAAGLQQGERACVRGPVTGFQADADGAIRRERGEAAGSASPRLAVVSYLRTRR